MSIILSGPPQHLQNNSPPSVCNSGKLPINESTVEAVVKRVLKQEQAKQETYSMSQMTERGMTSLLKKSNFTIERMDLPPGEAPEIRFDWGERTEDQGTEDAVQFIRTQLTGVDFGPRGYKLVDIHRSKNTLDVLITDEVTLKGSTDVLVVPYLADALTYATIACVIFELKTTKALSNDLDKYCLQLVAETIALRHLSDQPAVLCVLTDLNIGAVIARTSWDNIIKKIVIEKSELLGINTMFDVVRKFLENSSVPSTRLPVALKGEYDPQYQQIIEFKRQKLSHGGESSLAMEQYEELVEGTAPFSRDRALAVRHLFQMWGFDEMPKCVSNYSHMYS